MGLGPSRKALKSGPVESIDRQSDDFDDIFAPDNQADAANQRSRAGAAKQGVSAQSGPSSVRTRLILRRALLRQTRASRHGNGPAPAQPLPITGTALRAHSAPSRVFRRPAAIRIAVFAVVGGALCGTALAYFINQHNAKESATGPSSFEQSTDIDGQKAPAAATSAQEETMPMAVPNESEPELERAAVEEPDPPALDEPPAQEPARLASAISPPASTRSAALAQPDEQSEMGPAKAVPPGAETFRDCELCPVMVKIPSAQFTMGSPSTEQGHQGNEEPQHLVKVVKPFAIGQFEITFDDWSACVKDGSCHEKLKDEGWGRGTRPAIQVSWEDITNDYLPWLSKKAGHVYRLPSEAEWEYAARAQGRTSFSFGSNSDEICAFGNGADQTAKAQNGAGSVAGCHDGFSYTAPVGSFRPNQLGLFDMHGNVWEWVEDCWNESYETAPGNSAAWTAGDCSSRVVRGGSWNSNVNKLRSAARGWNDPGGRNRSIGFRVARDL